jgi:hypothetical protein
MATQGFEIQVEYWHPASDRSGKPTGVRFAPRGLGTDSAVLRLGGRLAWQAASL